MTVDTDTMIVPAEFPELKLLVWNRDVATPMPSAEVFALYERNWRFVDTNRLTEREADLIQALTLRFGRGRLLVS